MPELSALCDALERWDSQPPAAPLPPTPRIVLQTEDTSLLGQLLDGLLTLDAYQAVAAEPVTGTAETAAVAAAAAVAAPVQPQLELLRTASFCAGTTRGTVLDRLVAFVRWLLGLV